MLQSTSPELLCATKYYSSTSLYYKVLRQYYLALGIYMSFVRGGREAKITKGWNYSMSRGSRQLSWKVNWSLDLLFCIFVGMSTAKWWWWWWWRWWWWWWWWCSSEVGRTLQPSTSRPSRTVRTVRAPKTKNVDRRQVIILARISNPGSYRQIYRWTCLVKRVRWFYL